MSNDDAVGCHRVEIQRRVEQRLALRNARRRDADVHRVGGESFGREFERCACACRGFEEKIYYRLPAERRNFLNLAIRDLTEIFCGVENADDVRGGKISYPE